MIIKIQIKIRCKSIVTLVSLSYKSIYNLSKRVVFVGTLHTLDSYSFDTLIIVLTAPWN